MKGKKIVLGVTGGIAAYKVAELVRLFVKADVQIKVAMTESATKFVTPLTFEALSNEKVIWDMWNSDAGSMEHISLGQESDLLIIAPATANFIAKMAHGIADDFLSTMVLAATAKILVCPAMNTLMFENVIVKENIRKLKNRGISVMEPGEGQLACRAEGKGRLPEPEDIVETSSILLSEQDLSGLTILVTAGATIEPLDPVRYITNRSSGKMGYALARAAMRRGAQAILVSGPTALEPPLGITYIGVKTAEEMRKAVLDRRRNCDVIIKAAAVSDYRPRQIAENKIKKRNESLSIELVKNPDILAELGNEEKNYRQILVGFAAETQDLLSNAEEKLNSKGLDMIVANDVSRTDAGFETDTNIVKILYKNGKVEDSGLLSKHEVADLLMDRVKKLWEGRN